MYIESLCTGMKILSVFLQIVPVHIYFDIELY